MRLLQVIQELAVGGAERTVVALDRGAVAAGHVTAVAAAPGPLERELDGPVFPLPLLERRPWRVPSAVRALSRAIDAWGPDVVHCHNPGMAVVASIVTRRGRRVPALVTMHGVPDEDYAAASRVLRLAGLPTVACGPGVAAALAEHGAAVVGVVPTSVSPAPKPAVRAWIGTEFGFDPAAALVVAVGRLVPQKNFALALRALADVPGAALLLLGEGPLRPGLEELAGAVGVRDRVVFAGARADAREILGAADAVVIPSEWEGLPRVALEALAAGRPVVATVVRGLRELLTDEATALLVPAGDAEALAAALRRLLEDGSLADALGRAGRELAALYSQDTEVERYLDLYASLSASEGRS